MAKKWPDTGRTVSTRRHIDKKNVLISKVFDKNVDVVVCRRNNFIKLLFINDTLEYLYVKSYN